MNYRQIIDRFKKKSGLTQRAIARQIFGITDSNLSNRIKRGTVDISPIVNWAKQKNVDLNWLLTGDTRQETAPADEDFFHPEHAKKLARNLVLVRKALGDLSQKEMARKLALRPEVYRQYEAAEREFPPRLIHILFSHFNINAVWWETGAGEVIYRPKPDPVLMMKIVDSVNDRLTVELSTDNKEALVSRIYEYLVLLGDQSPKVLEDVVMDFIKIVQDDAG